MTRRRYRNTSPDFLTCPDCGKRGVTFRMKLSEDQWACRTPGCDWYAFTGGNDEPDVVERKRLADANPTVERLDKDGLRR